MIVPERTKRNLPEKIIIHEDLELQKTLSKQDLARLNTLVIQSTEIWQREKNEIWLAVEKSDTQLLNFLQEKAYGFSFELEQSLFNKPVTFLLGKFDTAVGYQDAFELLGKYPRAGFFIFDKSGHSLMVEQEELFNHLVSDWLKRVNEEF
jgi:pimeloyl-ACP methyl ester carboxylesterase